VVFASERMNDDPRWRLLDAGELVHVDPDLNITRRMEFPDPPKRLLQPPLGSGDHGAG
jgi:glutamine amidotransferase